jgi:FAD/FMN-containing dehydrogenase
MNNLLEKVRALLGAEAVLDPGAAGVAPRIAPPTPEAVALLLRTATEEGWKVRIEGSGSWQPADTPADLALTTRRLDQVEAVEPRPRRHRAPASVGPAAASSSPSAAWVASTHPVRRPDVGLDRGVRHGGPLRQGLGPVRDHLLGVSAITGDGRAVSSGGRVVKTSPP